MKIVYFSKQIKKSDITIFGTEYRNRSNETEKPRDKRTDRQRERERESHRSREAGKQKDRETKNKKR